MKRRIAIILGVIAIAAIIYSTASHYWDVHLRNQRQRRYEDTLAAYSREVKSGMTRTEVESILINKGVVLSHEPYGGPQSDDFIKIGREQDLWYCSWENIDIQFHFAPLKPDSIEPASFDALGEIKLSRWPYDCL